MRRAVIKLIYGQETRDGVAGIGRECLYQQKAVAATVCATLVTFSWRDAKKTLSDLSLAV